MRKLLLFTAAALCLVGCEKNVQSNFVKGSTFYCIDDQSSDMCYTEYFLIFDKPHDGMITDSISETWHEEPDVIGIHTPIIWEYTIDGTQITFVREHQLGYDTCHAIYRKDSIYFMNKAYYRLLNR